MVYYSPDRYNDDMFLVGLLGWWYDGGRKQRFQTSRQHIKGVAGFFSIGQLLSTLFAPFRQISAGQVDGPIGVQLRAFFDKLISRVIGSIVRLMTIAAAIIILTFVIIYESMIAVLWLLLPLFPVAGLILTVIGWTPSWL